MDKAEEVNIPGYQVETPTSNLYTGLTEKDIEMIDKKINESEQKLTQFLLDSQNFGEGLLLDSIESQKCSQGE